jgi:FtsP/CotA-like multicopper oxidase with cupredoxin domain
VLPQEIFNVCISTQGQGSREVIKPASSAKWIALDVISAAGFDSLAFSIDEHPLWVYAVDGHYIEPLKVDVLSVSNGDRYSVFVKLDKPANNYGIRLASTALAQLIDTTAVLAYSANSPKYNGVEVVKSKRSITRAGLPVSSNVTVLDQNQMVSFPPQFPQPPPKVDQTFILNSVSVKNSFIWALNDTTFPSAVDNTNPPLLYQQPNDNNPGANITLTTKNGTWVDLIFAVPTLGQPPHPIHKHSNKAFIIGQGTGAFTWSSVAEAAAAQPQSFDLVTPPYRDGFVTPASAATPTWLAVRYHVVNPGAWLLHCHIQTHLNGGMAMVILDGVDEWPQVPAGH